MAINNPYEPSDGYVSGSASNPYGAPRPGRAPTAPTAAVAGPQRQQPNQDLPPLLGLGQGILKGLLTPWAGSVGALDAVLRNITKGESNNPIEAIGQNIGALWGMKGFDFGGVTTGETILKETLGVEEEMFKIPAAFAQNLPGVGSLARINVASGKEDAAIPVGTNLFWGGLGIDIFADPLTYGTKGLSQVIKGTAKAGASTVKGARLAKAGEVAETTARARGITDPTINNWGNIGSLRTPQNLKSIQENIFKVDPQAAGRIAKAQERLANNQYKTVRIDAPRTLSEASKDVIASAMDAGVKSITNSFVSARTANFLRNYAARDIGVGIGTKLRVGRKLVANVVKDPGSSNYLVLSGNKVKLGEAASKTEAERLARDIQKGLNPMSGLVAVGQIQGARKIVEEGAEAGIEQPAKAATVPATDGADVTLNQWAPHQGDDGKFYVFDGENIAQFESVEDAQSWIDVYTSPARENVEPVLGGKSGNYTVTVGKQVTKFKTKKEAQAYMNAVRTGEIPQPAATRGGTPILDTAPPQVPVEEALKIPSKTEASALKSVLKKIDNIAKKTSGWTKDVPNGLVNQVKQILSKNQETIDRILINAEPEIYRDIKLFLDGEISSKILFTNLEESTNAARRQIADVLKKTVPVRTTKGAISFGDALQRAKGDFLKLTRTIEGVDGSELEQQVSNYILNNIVKRGQALKDNKIKPAGTPEGRYDALVRTVGQDVADKIKKTGHLDNVNEKTTKAYNQILKDLETTTSEVSYKGYDDLIAGLERGDDVSDSALQEIFNLIDPDGGIVNKVAKINGEPNSAFLRRAFTREGGVTTIREAEKRLAMMRDPAILMQDVNLAYSSEAEALIELIKRGDKQAVADTTAISTKQAAAGRFGNLSQSMRDDIADTFGRAFRGDKEGELGALSLKKRIMEDPDAVEQISTLDEWVYLNGEPYADGSRAMFARQMQQSMEQKMLSSFLAKSGYRRKQAKAQALEAGKTFKPSSLPERLTRLIEQMYGVNDYANSLGFRFTRTKNRNDVTFQKAYQKALETAKETSTTPNFSALAEKHTVYLPMASILDILRANGGEASLLKAIFPQGDVAKNSMDWISIGDAARRVIEMDSAGEVFDVNEIATRLLRRGDSREMPAASRMAALKEVANDLADILTKPEVVAELKAVHLDNALAIVKDSADKAEIFANDLFHILDDTFSVMHINDELTEAAKVDAVREFFRRFVLSADIMRLQDGPVAEAMFKAIALTMADGGRVLPPSKLGKKLTPEQQRMYGIIREEEFRGFREAMTKMYRYQDLPSAPPGREGMKAPKPAAKEKAETQLQEIMSQYKAHMEELPTVESSGDTALIKKWEQTQKKLQTKLDKVRENAWNNWVQTYHWLPEGRWVETELFDHGKAVREAQQIHNAYVAGIRGQADRVVYLSDSAPVVPPHKILSAAEKRRFLAKYEKDHTAAKIENSASIVDDQARNVADEVLAGRLDNPELSSSELMMNGAQNAIARGLKEELEIQVKRVRSTYKGAIPKNTVEFNQQFRPLLDPETPAFPSDRRAAKLGLLAEQWSGYTGRQDLAPLLKHAENSSITDSSNMAEYMDAIQRRYRNASVDDWDAAWAAVRDNEFSEGMSRTAQLLAKDLEAPIRTIFTGHAKSVMTTEGITGRVLEEAFSRFGLTEKNGFPKIGDLTGKTPEELIDSLFNQLPFGTTPRNLRGTDEAIAWAQKREVLRKSDLSPSLAFVRLMEAVQMVKMEKGIATQAVAQFGWKAHFRSYDDAVKAGWVQIEASGPQSIARFLPDAEGGNLFHPDIADQMGSIFREYNNMYNTVGDAPALRRFANQAMKVVGVIKFTQTQLMPRHHMTNLIGDSSTAMIAGVRNPVDWYDGFGISNRFTATNAAADWGRFTQDFEAKAMRMAGAFADEPGTAMPRPGQADDVTLNFYKDGKAQAQVISKDRLAEDFGRRGILVPGFVQSDIQGLTGEMLLEGSTIGQKRAFAEMWQHVSRGGRNVMKGFSDFTAAYSNGIRAAHAMKIARSRPWSSYEEMMNEITRVINKYHPTVQSLASTERRWGRLLFTYYTWIRVAHSALLDMAVNHTAAMLAVPKGMYNYSVMQGFRPESPAVPFENQNVLPDYISYSVYGPNAMDEQGPRTYRPPFLPLDVLDFWQIYSDPSKPTGENVLNITRGVGETFGKSFNILGKPILASISGAPGGPKNPVELAEDALSNLGFTSLLTGLGVYTPYRYRDSDTTNPLTDADRRRLLENSFSGMRSVDIYRPINIKLGQSQYGSRIKQLNERILERNRQQVQSFVDDKLSEGYNREQILQMLRQMGVTN